MRGAGDHPAEREKEKEKENGPRPFVLGYELSRTASPPWELRGPAVYLLCEMQLRLQSGFRCHLLTIIMVLATLATAGFLFRNDLLVTVRSDSMAGALMIRRGGLNLANSSREPEANSKGLHPTERILNGSIDEGAALVPSFNHTVTVLLNHASLPSPMPTLAPPTSLPSRMPTPAPSNMANHQMLRGGIQSTVARAAAITRGCDVVLYTTVFYGAAREFSPSEPRGKCKNSWMTGHEKLGQLCCVLIMGRSSANALLTTYKTVRFRPWRLLVMDVPRSEGRYWSRLAKLLPHRVFTTVPITVFADWKLYLRQDPRLLVNASLTMQNASFAAWRHPCATVYPYTLGRRCYDGKGESYSKAQPWLFQEAHFLQKLRKNDAQKVGNWTKLSLQVERYQQMYLSGELYFEHFLDGGLLIRDSRSSISREINERWWSEYSKSSSSDRDQLSLSYAVSMAMKVQAQRSVPKPSLLERLLGNAMKPKANTTAIAYTNRSREPTRGDVVQSPSESGVFFVSCTKPCKLAHWSQGKQVAVLKGGLCSHCKAKTLSTDTATEIIDRITKAIGREPFPAFTNKKQYRNRNQYAKLASRRKQWIDAAHMRSLNASSHMRSLNESSLKVNETMTLKHYPSDAPTDFVFSPSPAPTDASKRAHGAVSERLINEAAKYDIMLDLNQALALLALFGTAGDSADETEVIVENIMLHNAAVQRAIGSVPTVHPTLIPPTRHPTDFPVSTPTAIPTTSFLPTPSPSQVPTLRPVTPRPTPVSPLPSISQNPTPSRPNVKKTDRQKRLQRARLERRQQRQKADSLLRKNREERENRK